MRRGVHSKKKKKGTTAVIAIGLNLLVWGGLALLFAIHKIEVHQQMDVTMVAMKAIKFKPVKPPASKKSVAKPKAKSRLSRGASHKPGPPHPHFMATAPSSSGSDSGPTVQSGGTGKAGQLFTTPAKKAVPTAPPVPAAAVSKPKPTPTPVVAPPIKSIPAPMILHKVPEGATRDATPVQMTNPVIPDSLRGTALTTSVTARIHVSSEGTTSVQLLTSSGSDEIDKIVLDTLSKWTWTPQLVDGVPVPTVVDYKVEIAVQ